MGSRVGVCCGMHGNNMPAPAEIVEQYKSQKINKMRLFDPDSNLLKALKGSNIELILDVPWDKLQDFATNGQAAGDWVYWNVMVYYPDVLIKCITVGNEVLADDPKEQYVLPAMRNVYNALKAANLHGKIKVSTAVHMGVLGDSNLPSATRFSSQFMPPIVQFLASIGSPLLCNVYPYFAYKKTPDKISLDYALFKSPGTVVTDGNLQYKNLFDAMVDSMYAAIENVDGGAGVGIIVSETGWPWSGGFAASLDNAGSYNWHIINHVGNGTPKRPGPLETYIFAMFNENQKNGDETEKYFGLFHCSRRMPVYPLDF